MRLQRQMSLPKIRQFSRFQAQPRFSANGSRSRLSTAAAAASNIVSPGSAPKTAPYRVLVFSGSTFGLPTLRTLNLEKSVVSRVEVVCPDDRIVRKEVVPGESILPEAEMTECAAPVKKEAQGLGIASHPLPADTDFRMTNWQMPAVHQSEPFDLGVVISFGHFIPKRVIESFPLGMINVHPSILPKYRGASPIQHALMAGDTETGLSIIEVDPNAIDTGRIIDQTTMPIAPDATYQILHAALAELGASRVLHTLRNYDELRRNARHQEREKQASELKAKEQAAEQAKQEKKQQQLLFLSIPGMPMPLPKKEGSEAITAAVSAASAVASDGKATDTSAANVSDSKPSESTTASETTSVVQPQSTAQISSDLSSASSSNAISTSIKPADYSAPKLKREAGLVKWSSSNARAVFNQWRALCGFMPVFTFMRTSKSSSVSVDSSPARRVLLLELADYSRLPHEHMLEKLRSPASVPGTLLYDSVNRLLLIQCGGSSSQSSDSDQTASQSQQLNVVACRSLKVEPLGKPMSAESFFHGYLGQNALVLFDEKG